MLSVRTQKTRLGSPVSVCIRIARGTTVFNNSLNFAWIGND